MRFAIVGEHRKVFEENQFIHFEEFLSNSSLQQFRNHVDQAVLANTRCHTLDDLTFSQVIDEGKDIALQNSECKKIIHQKNFAELIYQLGDVKPLRYAYDQLLIRNRKHAGRKITNIALKDISHLQGRLFGLLICLKKSPHENDEEPQQTQFPFNIQEGDALIFTDTLTFNLDLFSNKTEVYLLIVYSEAKARVIYREQRSFLNSFKKYGYLSGDLLKDNLHPIIFR